MEGEGKRGRRSEGERKGGEMAMMASKNFLDCMCCFRSFEIHVAVELQLLSVDIKKEALQRHTHHRPYSPSP